MNKRQPMKASTEKYKSTGALLIAALAVSWSFAVQAVTLECRSESVTPGKDAAKAKQPHKPVGQKFDLQVGLPAPHFEWKATDKRYLKDFVIDNWRNTVFWVDRETGEYWILEFSATYSADPKLPRVIERYYEYTGKCIVKNIDQKF
jgi:hypothetical protein